VAQGDDHLRLLKTVLQNCFPGLDKSIFTVLAGYSPTSHTHPYLPLAGGTLTGNVFLTATGLQFVGNSANDVGYLNNAGAQWMLRLNKDGSLHTLGGLETQTTAQSTFNGPVYMQSYFEHGNPSVTKQFTGGGLGQPSMTSTLRVTSNSSSAAAIGLVREGAYGVNLGIDTDNVLKFGGWNAGAVANKVWHDGIAGGGTYWMKLPGGQIHQWGNSVTDAGGGKVITFPVAFPSAVLNVQVTPVQPAPTQAIAVVIGPGASGFTAGIANMGTGIASTFYWFASGA
jgi:hypothetical protein